MKFLEAKLKMHLFQRKEIGGIALEASIMIESSENHFIRSFKIELETQNSTNQIRISRTDNPNN